MNAVAMDFWTPVLRASVAWVNVRPLVEAAEKRRSAASYQTGSILSSEAYALLSLANFLQARTVIEVGTFIGLSTTALAAGACVEAVYTCDASNDCLPATDVIRTYPKQTSTFMLRDLLGRGVKADLCFFDGVLSPQDALLLRDLTHPRTVYAFHDYNFGPKIRAKHGKVWHETVPRKGIGNVQTLRPQLKHFELIEPRDGTTLALLVPGDRP